MKKNAEKKNQLLIYVGPQFRDFPLRTFGIFPDGVPKAYQGTIYEKLFVQPGKLDETRAQIAKKGTPYHIFYQQAVTAHEKKEG